MKISEILGKLAEVIAQQEQAQQGQIQGQGPSPARLQAVAVPNVDNTEAEVMVTPLQQKLEILKKSAGVDSFYDQEPECCEPEQPDELNLIRRMAGIQVAAGSNDIEE